MEPPEASSRAAHKRTSSLFDDLQTNADVDTRFSSGFTVGKKQHRENYFDYDDPDVTNAPLTSSGASTVPQAGLFSSKPALLHEYDDGIPERNNQTPESAPITNLAASSTLQGALKTQEQEDALLRQYLCTLTPTVRTLLEGLMLDAASNRLAILKQAQEAADSFSNANKKDWNREFQNLLSQEDSEAKFRDLYHLAHDFVYAAKTYAKIIISELLLPPSQKTIQPAAMGGVAGGTKFIVQNILFKFVLDFELKPGLWMYGGDQRSDENALKAASLELKGLMSYYSCNIPGLAFPLMSVIDYKGYRVVALSILPIGGSTLCYGSPNAGKTVFYENADVNQKMEEAGRLLMLKKHFVSPTVELSSPGDLEVHLGPDGLYYVLDFGRVFPPEAPVVDPTRREKRQVYFKCLRPELLRKYGNPLCSDAFTNWQKNDPHWEENNEEVRKATTFLVEVAIPAVAKKMDESISDYISARDQFDQTRAMFARRFAQVAMRQAPGAASRLEKLSSDDLTRFSSDPVKTEEEIIKYTEMMHREGINLRHMGLVRSKSQVFPVRRCLLTEMLARVIKDLFRGQMRATSRQVRNLADEPYKEMIIRLLNLVLGRDEPAHEFWNLVQERLVRKFHGALTREEQDDDPLSLGLKVDSNALIRRIESLVGVKIEEEAKSQLRDFPDAFEFVQSDIAEVYPKAKHMNLVDYAEGMALYLAAAGRKSMGPRERLRLLHLSCARFARALSTLPDSYVTLYQWGLALLEESKLHSDSRKVLESAAEKFSAALEIKPNFQGCWVKLAEVLIEIAKLVKKPKKTKELLKQAAEAFDKALSPDDFFLDVAIKKVQESRDEAINQRYSSRVRSREFYNGSMELCEVIYNSIVQGRQRIQQSLAASSTRSPRSASSSSNPSQSTSNSSLHLEKSTASAPTPSIAMHRVEMRTHKSESDISHSDSAYYGDESKEPDSRRKIHVRSSSGIVFDGPRQRPSTTAVPKLRTSSKGYQTSQQSENALLKSKDDLLKKAEVQILLLWADCMIQYAAAKKSDTLCETLFSNAAEKYVEAVGLDEDSLSEVLKRVESFEQQAKENRRFYFAIAQLCRVLHALTTKDSDEPSPYMMKWGLNLISYAKLHQEDPVKHASLHKDAGRVIERALQSDESYFDDKLRHAFHSRNGTELVFHLRLMMDSSTLFRRARNLGASVTTVDLRGSSAVTDFMLMTLVDICPSIESVSVTGCRRISDQTLLYAGSKLGARIKLFDGSGCDSITDVGVVTLCKDAAVLEVLRLANCSSLSDTSLSAAFRLPQLRVLDLEKTRVQGRIDASNFPRTLTDLNVSHCKLEDPAFIHILRGSTSMQKLRLNACSMISDSAVAKVSTILQDLRTLHLHSLYRVTDTAVSSILSNLSMLEDLELKNCKSITWAGLAAAFEKCSGFLKLRRLDMSRMGNASASSSSHDDTSNAESDKISCIRAIAVAAGSRLERLDLSECHLPDKCIQELVEHVGNKLVSLDLSENHRIKFKTVLALCEKAGHLRKLKLNGCQGLKKHFDAFALSDNVPQLTCLEISKIPLHDDQLASICVNLPKLEKLVLAECQGSTDSSKVTLLQDLTNLKQLSLTKWNPVTDADLIPLVCNLPRLEKLCVDMCYSLTNEFLFVVAQHCTAMQTLILSRNANFSDAGITAVAEGTLNLRCLDISGVSRLTDQALLSLARYQPMLEDLNIAECPRLTEKGISKLQGLSRIKLQMEMSQNKLFLKELSAKTRESSRARSFSDIEHYIQSSRTPRSTSLSPVTPELRAKFDTMARHHLAEVGSDFEVVYEPFTCKHSLQELQSGNLIQCDPERLERYLDEAEFHRLFEMSSDDFAKLPTSQQKRMKSQLRLY